MTVNTAIEAKLQDLRDQLNATYVDVDGIERSKLTQAEKFVIQSQIHDLHDYELEFTDVKTENVPLLNHENNTDWIWDDQADGWDSF